MALTFTILVCALATYMTRVGGYILIKSFAKIPLRVEAALNGVPAAVLAALIAPTLVFEGPDVTLTLLLAGIVGLCASSLTMLATAWIFIVAVRYFTG